MNVRNFSLVLALVAFSVSSVSAQNFFWSEANIGEGVVAGDLAIDGTAGSGTAYLYYQANGQNIGEGVDLDFSWDGGGAAFTAAETFDYDIEVMGIPAGQVRWGNFSGPAEEVLPGSVTGFLTVNVNQGVGLVATNDGSILFTDSGYDADSASFQIGSFDWTFGGQPGPAGSSNLVIDNALVVDGGADIGATFSGLTISAAIPEPTSAGLLALGLVGLVARRRR